MAPALRQMVLEANMEATHVTFMYFIDENSVTRSHLFFKDHRERGCFWKLQRVDVLWSAPHQHLLGAWWVWFTLVLTVGQLLKGTLLQDVAVMDMYQ